MITLFIFIAIWLFIGGASFIYWWTSEYDFTTEQIPLMFGAALAGPISFIGGWVIHGDGKTIFKKRQ